MLTAITENGRHISLVANWDKSKLQKICQGELLLCPACKEQVQIKMGLQRIWHFAHVSKKDCKFQHEHESEYHRKGKIDLYHWFKKQNIDAELEVYLPKITQRPDLLVNWNKQAYAIEYQCSTIDKSLLLKRTNSYLKENIKPIWVVGGNRLKKSREHVLKLTAFDLQLLYSTTGSDLRLIYYCSTTANFYIASSLIPFSSNTFLASAAYFHINGLSFSKLIGSGDIYNHRVSDDNVWVMMKKRWRTNTCLYTHDYYKRMFYEKGLPLSLLPAEAGLPLKSMIWIKTDAILWQGWILLEFIIPLAYGETISFQDVYQSFKAEVQKGHFQVRQLPSLKHSHYSFAIMEYLQQLQKLNILKVVDSRSTFRKCADINIPKNIENACRLDREVLKKLER